MSYEYSEDALVETATAAIMLEEVLHYRKHEKSLATRKRLATKKRKGGDLGEGLKPIAALN